MMQSIRVPMDGPDEAMSALENAAKLASIAGAELRGLFAEDEEEFFASGNRDAFRRAVQLRDRSLFALPESIGGSDPGLATYQVEDSGSIRETLPQPEPQRNV
jgi:nucleotide-binding universal stress UspA family protein